VEAQVSGKAATTESYGRIGKRIKEVILKREGAEQGRQIHATLWQELASTTKDRFHDF
jgi:hypothetical protein